MANTKKTSDKQNGQDAIALLIDDHKKVKKLFKDFEKLKQDGENGAKAALVRQVCLELTVHARIEEEIFYPAAAKVIDEQDLLDEAEVEHASAKDLIGQLQSMKPGDDLYDARFIVLSEYVKHHVSEEEGELFPQVQKSQLDLEALGAELAQRKQELMEEMEAGDGSYDESAMEDAEPALADGDDDDDDGPAKKRKSTGGKAKAASHSRRAGKSSN